MIILDKTEKDTLRYLEDNFKQEIIQHFSVALGAQFSPEHTSQPFENLVEYGLACKKYRGIYYNILWGEEVHRYSYTISFKGLWYCSVLDL